MLLAIESEAVAVDAGAAGTGAAFLLRCSEVVAGIFHTDVLSGCGVSPASGNWWAARTHRLPH